MDAQLQGDDAQDLKALGVLAANIGTIALLATVHGNLPLWWFPVVVLAIGVVFLLSVVWPVELYDGPDWGKWYAQSGALDLDAARRQMLADLLSTMTVNASRIRYKGRYFKTGFVLTFVGLGASVIVVLTR